MMAAPRGAAASRIQVSQQDNGDGNGTNREREKVQRTRAGAGKAPRDVQWWQGWCAGSSGKSESGGDHDRCSGQTSSRHSGFGAVRQWPKRLNGTPQGDVKPRQVGCFVYRSYPHRCGRHTGITCTTGDRGIGGGLRSQGRMRMRMQGFPRRQGGCRNVCTCGNATQWAHPR